MRFDISTFLLYQTALTLSYEPDEVECPEKDSIIPEIFLTGLKIPPGTPFRSMLTLPESFALNMSVIPGRGVGIFTKTYIKAFTWLGEYEGEYIPMELSDDRETYDYAWRARRDGEDDRLIDARDESLANWLRYVNCARHIREENVQLSLCFGRVYFRTKKDLTPNTELLIYCGDDYNETYLNLTKETYLSKMS